jgi:hypothetical protein
MRVVAAVRAVTDDHHQWREMPGQADAAQEAADARDLFVLAEAEPRRLGAGDAAGFGGLGGQLQAPGSGFSKVARAASSCPQAPRRERSRQQSEQGRGAAAAVSSAACRQPRRLPWCRRSCQARRSGADAADAALCCLAAAGTLFAHGVLGRTTIGHKAVGASSSRPCQSIGTPKNPAAPKVSKPD